MIDLDKLARLIALDHIGSLADIDAMAIAEAAEEPLTAEQIGQIYERLGRIIAALRRSLAAEATADGEQPPGYGPGWIDTDAVRNSRLPQLRGERGTES